MGENNLLVTAHISLLDVRQVSVPERKRTNMRETKGAPIKFPSLYSLHNVLGQNFHRCKHFLLLILFASEIEIWNLPGLLREGRRRRRERRYPLTRTRSEA